MRSTVWDLHILDVNKRDPSTRQHATRWYARLGVEFLNHHRAAHPELAAWLEPVKVAPCAEVGRVRWVFAGARITDESEQQTLSLVKQVLAIQPPLSAKAAARALQRWRLDTPETAATVDAVSDALWDTFEQLLTRYPRTPYAVLEEGLDQIAQVLEYFYGDDGHLEEATTPAETTTEAPADAARPDA